MSIRPVDLNGMVQRSQDVGTLKQQEDAKPMVDQQNIQTHVGKQGEQKLKQVVHADDANEQEYRYDAKEKGNSQYEQQKNKKRDRKKEDGKIKTKGMSGGFDIRI